MNNKVNVKGLFKFSIMRRGVETSPVTLHICISYPKSNRVNVENQHNVYFKLGIFAKGRIWSKAIISSQTPILRYYVA